MSPPSRQSARNWEPPTISSATGIDMNTKKTRIRTNRRQLRRGVRRATSSRTERTARFRGKVRFSSLQCKPPPDSNPLSSRRRPNPQQKGITVERRKIDRKWARNSRTSRTPREIESSRRGAKTRHGIHKTSHSPISTKLRRNTGCSAWASVQLALIVVSKAFL